MRFAYGTGEDLVQEKALYKEKEVKVTSSQVMQLSLIHISEPTRPY